MPYASTSSSPDFPSGTLAGEAHILYRMPGEEERISLRGPCRLFRTNAPISSGKNGFAIAAFSEEEPFIWVEAEEVKHYPGDIPVTEFTIAVPADLPPGQVYSEESHAAYLESVRGILDLIESGIASKVVYTRQFSRGVDPSLKPPELFNILCRLYPEAFIYLARIPGKGLWLGASPETLLKYDGKELTAMALAGTRPAGTTGAWPDKEIREHDYVSEHIRHTLTGGGCQDIVQSDRESIIAGRAMHLRTSFRARSTPAGVGGMAAALHPTPAVCGLPTPAALEIIRQTEHYSRALYTGYLGPVKDREVALFVNLRCLQLLSGRAILYVGGGLVEGSDPEAEWRETELKSTTMLAAIDKLQNFTS